MSTSEDRLRRLEVEIERKLLELFAGLRDEFDRLRVESDQRWAGFLSRFDQDFRGFVPPELFETPAPAPAPAPAQTQAQAPSPAAAGALPIGEARDLDEAGNQVDVLHKYLELARSHASRTALLIARGDALGVWKAMGFTEHGSGDDVVRRVALSMSAGGPLVRVMEGLPVDLGAGSDVSQQLNAADAVKAVLIPMVVKEKVSGALYADCVAAETDRFDPGALGLLTYVAGLVVDRLATRKLRPAPALRPAETFVPKKRETEAPLDLTPEPETAADADEEFELVGETTNPPSPSSRTPSPTSPPPPPPPPAAPAPPRALEATAPRGARPAAPAPAILHFEDSSPGSGYRGSRPDVLAAAATPGPASPVLSTPPPPAPAGAIARPSLGARRLAGPLAPAEGDERREEARRFAKLLVSEIKLYNERAVMEGREKGNIYERLKEDIDRSRQMYDERIPEDVRKSSNFFVEELVRILADGRSEALGL